MKSAEQNSAHAAGQPICLRGVSKSFGEQKVLQNVDLQLACGSRTVLIGPSGAGKSTLLRLLARLERPDEGSITGLPERISFVFDRDNLYESMTALENIACGLPQKAGRKKEIAPLAEKWAKRFCCSGFLHQKAKTLSAGQRQRTALARAMMKDPQLLLLDESFSSLDGALRQQLYALLLQIQKEKHFTLVCITHSLEEAFYLNSDVLLAEHGKVICQNSMLQAMNDPKTLYEAGAGGLFGMNLLPAAWFGRTGSAAISLADCMAAKEAPQPSGWERIDARYLKTEDFGWTQMAFFEKEQYLLRAIPQEKSSGHQPLALWIRPDGLRFFDAQGWQSPQL